MIRWLSWLSNIMTSVRLARSFALINHQKYPFSSRFINKSEKCMCVCSVCMLIERMFQKPKTISFYLLEQWTMFRFNSAILHFNSQFSSVVGLVRARDHIKSFTQFVRVFHFKIAFIFYLMHEYLLFIESILRALLHAAYNKLLFTVLVLSHNRDGH